MYILSLFAALLICAFQAKAHEEIRSDDASLLQQAVDGWMAKHVVQGGAVSAVLVTSESTQFFHAGNLHPKSSGSPNERTMYEIGSVSKGFTGLLLADQLLLKNVNEWDIAAKLLTDWSWPGRSTSAAGKVTLVELATHTSGFPKLPANMDREYLQQHAENPYATYTTKELYAWMDTVKCLTPGIFNYSNAGVGILGYALALSAGKPYEDLLKERILSRLGLGDTTITLNSNQASRIAPGHYMNGNAAHNWDWDVLASAGALRTSISDLARFLKLAAGIEKMDESMQSIFKLATHNWRKMTDDGFSVGLGWHRQRDGPTRFIYHSGMTGGYNSFIGWYPEQKIGVAVLSSLVAEPSTHSLMVDFLNVLRQTNRL